MAKVGTPGYPPEVVKRMQERIIEEVEKKRSLFNILDNDVDLEFPSAGLVYQWLNPEHHKYDAEFANSYARAREVRTEKIFEEMLEIADTTKKGKRKKTTKDGVEISEEDMLGHRRLQIETRQWMLARMMPKKYGNKLETTLQGGDKPIEVVDHSKFSDEFLEELAKQADAGKAKP